MTDSPTGTKLNNKVTKPCILKSGPHTLHVKSVRRSSRKLSLIARVISTVAISMANGDVICAISSVIPLNDSQLLRGDQECKNRRTAKM